MDLSAKEFPEDDIMSSTSPEESTMGFETEYLLELQSLARSPFVVNNSRSIHSCFVIASAPIVKRDVVRVYLWFYYEVLVVSWLIPISHGYLRMFEISSKESNYG